jgi:hypothetical protein
MERVSRPPKCSLLDEPGGYGSVLTRSPKPFVSLTSFGEREAARTLELAEKYGVRISSLGYYPNPLCADPIEREN